MIHSTAIVDRDATLGKNVNIGPYTIVHANAVIGDNTSIESHCDIGYPTPLAGNVALMIGKDSLIRSHSVFYQGSVFGDCLITGHRVTVREKVRAGLNLQIGTLCDLQGDCEIGDYVRMHSSVHIGKAARIGNFVRLYPYVVLTNDPHPPSEVLMGVHVCDYAVVATASVILPGVEIREHGLVAAHSLVNRNVEPHTVVGGVPAKKLCDASEIRLKDGTNGVAYPWPRHFHRGYPESVVDAWIKEYEGEHP